MPASTPLRVVIASAISLVLLPSPASAGRGGGGGGGGHAGGGGGGHPGGGGGGHPGGGYGGGGHPGGGYGGGGHPGGGYGGGGGMARPSYTNSPTFSTPRPSYHPAPAANNLNRTNVNANNVNRTNVNANNINRTNANANNINRTNVNRTNVNENTFNRNNVNANTFNRTNVNANTVNRTNVNANTFNRTNVNANTFNRTNVNANTFNRTNVSNTVVNNNYTRVTNASRGGYGGGGGGGWPGRSPYWGYHQNWVNGAWNSHYYPSYGGGYGGGYGGYGGGVSNFGLLGLGFVGGLATYGIGSALAANWGYSRYNNPYYYGAGAGYGYPSTTVIVQQPGAAGQPYYNYAQPINTLSAPPDATAAQAAVATFESARQAFKAGDYTTALAQTDAALVTMPNDPTMHEFRALVLFAQRRYDDAAAVLYAVLAAGPGWDWTTLVGLYPSVDAYTSQLRALEDDSRANPDKASDHFVLAYHYLTEGFPDNATFELKQVVRLQPNDTLAPRLLAQLTPPAAGAAANADTPPAAPAADPNAFRGSLVGTWTATPAGGTPVTLTVAPDGNFSWSITDPSGPRNLKGGATYGNDVLTLAPSTGDPLVGRVTWVDASHFTFQAAGGGANDPGLAFQKTDG